MNYGFEETVPPLEIMVASAVKASALQEEWLAFVPPVRSIVHKYPLAAYAIKMVTIASDVSALLLALRVKGPAENEGIGKDDKLLLEIFL